MKKGFTLIEMIAVVLIMALLTLIILPTIINQVQSQKDNISASSFELIKGATELYLGENENAYPMVSGATYCIALETLTDDGKLKKPIKDLSTGKEIPLNKIVKVIVNSFGDGEYTLVDANACETVMPDVE